MQNAIEILLVEDNEGDIFLTRKTFEKGRIANKFEVAKDGEEALQLLRGEKPYQHISRPDLIFLDMNLPKIDGKQVLAAVKSDPDLENIPVVILTSSKAEQDVLRSYDLHCNAYITKPVTLDKFKDIVSATENFWFSIVILPPAKKIQNNEEATENYGSISIPA